MIFIFKLGDIDKGIRLLKRCKYSYNYKLLFVYLFYILKRKITFF